jgi:hypothetical protein
VQLTERGKTTNANPNTQEDATGKVNLRNTVLTQFKKKRDIKVMFICFCIAKRLKARTLGYILLCVMILRELLRDLAQLVS